MRRLADELDADAVQEQVELLEVEGAVAIIINVLDDRAITITNKLLVYFLKLLSGAPTVDWKYFVRLVVTALLKNSFVILWADFMMVNESRTFNYK